MARDCPHRFDVLGKSAETHGSFSVRWVQDRALPSSSESSSKGTDGPQALEWPHGTWRHHQRVHISGSILSTGERLYHRRWGVKSTNWGWVFHPSSAQEALSEFPFLPHLPNLQAEPHQGSFRKHPFKASLSHPCWFCFPFGKLEKLLLTSDSSLM